MIKEQQNRKISPMMKRKAMTLVKGVEYEYFLNGIFKFNISKLIEYIDKHEEEFEVVKIDVKDYYNVFIKTDLNPEYVEAADLNRSIILAEIAPDRLYHSYPGISEDYYSRGYNLIDGHHRLAKATETGLEKLAVYVVRMEQHIQFMAKGFEAYVDYWNAKLE